MAPIVTLLCSPDGAITKESIEWLETVFRNNVGDGQTEFNLEQFKKIVPSKNVRKYLVENEIFNISNYNEHIMSLLEILRGGSVPSV